MTWIQERDLSDFLLAAEEPTHLKWNASLARDKGDYVAPDLALRSIRQAVPRLLAVLLGGSAKKDFTSLARYFSKPATDSTKKLAPEGSNKKKDLATPPPPSSLPPPVSKPFRIESNGATVRVVPNGTKGPQNSQLPVMAVLELAYEELDQDPFAGYDPYDFDVAQLDVYPVKEKGMSVTARSGNRIEVEITECDFKLEIGGFDPNVRMRARLNYTMPGTPDAESKEVGDG
jgi:hypothetical protein